MSNKRKHTEVHPDSAFYTKRSKPSSDGRDDSPNTSQSRIDPTYGQRGAFPGLDDTTGDNSLFYGPASDGLEYLRMVRSEARSVPNLLVAPVSPTAHPQKEESYIGYSRGYYADGAYTAASPPSSKCNAPQANALQDEDIDPQDAYYASLCTRFAKLSEILQSPNPSNTPIAPDIEPIIRGNHRRWRGKILNTSPTMILLAQLPQDSVIIGLEVLESVLTIANLGKGKGKTFGAWGWGLLARCREVGQMASEEVGIMRKLGKQGVWLLRRISAGEVVDGRVDEEDAEGLEEEISGYEEEDKAEEGAAGDLDDEDGVDGSSTLSVDGLGAMALAPNDEDTSYSPLQLDAEETDASALAKARKRALASLGSTDQAKSDSAASYLPNDGDVNRYQEPATSVRPDTETGATVQVDSNGNPNDRAIINATLDMLVTIIGEFYGQRDLLDGRLLWDEMQ